MSVIPLPKPEPEPSVADERARTGSDDDGWALLEALRRRLDDQAAQGRKTHHQVSQLADSIGALVAEQRRRSKWLNLNSFVAYLIFTVVVGAGFYALYRSRANELLEARNTARTERDLAAHRADEATAKVVARERADAVAWEAYELLEAGKRTEAQTKLASLGTQPLSRTERAVLAARAHETQVMEVEAALKAAAGSFKAGRYGDVVAPLEAALVGEPSGARSGAMHYFLGVAYAKANDLAKATSHLQIAVTADTEHDDVRFQLASALDRSGQYAKARAEYDQFATAHPQSGLAVFAMRRSATLARMPAVAPVTPKAIAPATGATGVKPPTVVAPTNGAVAAPTSIPPTNVAPANPSPTPTTVPKPAPKWPAANTAPKPATPPATPAPKPAPKQAPVPKPVEDTTPVAPTNEGSAAVAPMSTTPFDMRDGMSTAGSELSPRDDRQSISIDRGARATAPMSVTPTTIESNLDVKPKLDTTPNVDVPADDAMSRIAPMSTSSVERSRPARDNPSTNIEDAGRDRAPTELPSTPKAGTPVPSMPPAPPTERAPAPTHEPPVDREPAPAPRTPPRAETTPPHERF